MDKKLPNTNFFPKTPLTLISCTLFIPNKLKLKKYYIDELKSTFAIASASYSIKANLSETHKSTECLSNDSDITDYTNLDADTHYDTSEPILL